MWQGGVSFLDSITISIIGMFVVMLELIVLAVFIIILSKIVRSLEKSRKTDEKKCENKNDVVKAQMPIVALAKQQNTESGGEIEIYKVTEEETVAIMAAVSAEYGLPLDSLSFKSIKNLTEV